MSRFEDAPILGSWDVFLNVLNIETEDGATGAHLRRVLFGKPETGHLPRYDEVMGQLYIQVLRPLCWAGLLQQGRGTASYRFEERTRFTTDKPSVLTLLGAAGARVLGHAPTAPRRAFENSHQIKVIAKKVANMIDRAGR